jgi:hypothetical protein
MRKMKIKPSVYIAMPCYDSVKIGTMLSIVQLIQQLAKSGIEVSINTMKSPLIHQARNHLTSVFLTTEYQYLLFIDSDVEFKPEAILRMLVADKDICTTPYRVKMEDTNLKVYTIELEKNAKLEAGMVELKVGPTGLMLIKRKVFERIIKNHPELKIKNAVLPNLGKNHEYYYNFFDFAFKDGYSVGEDISFCRLAKDNDFRIYANTESETRHHGSYAWSGKFGDMLLKKETK